MGDDEELKLLQDQLEGLSKAVASDENLPVNMNDYLVTLGSLKKRIEAANKEPVGPVSAEQTPARKRFDDIAIKLAEEKAEELRLNPPIPIPNRRAAIQHTRKLNGLGDDS